MKKKFGTANRVSAIIVTLVSLALFRQCGLEVYAENNAQAAEGSGITGEEAAEETGAPERRLTMIIPLNSNETAQVPRYIVEENRAYMLDEASIVVEETERKSSYGADVVKVSRKVEDLTDNDLTRIKKEIVSEGIACELLSAVYRVEERDENGMPLRYSAVCEYGGLKKYSTSYPSAWQMKVCYDLCAEMTAPEVVEIREEMEITEMREDPGSVDTRTRRVVGDAADETESRAKEAMKREAAEKEEKPVPKANVRKILIKPEREAEGKMPGRITDLLVPLAAAVAVAGVTVPFIIWFSILTAPLYGMERKNRYRYIGRIRLGKKEGAYTAYLTRRLRERAMLPVFRIKLPRRVRKGAKTGQLQVRCPGGKQIMMTVGKTVTFTVEGD